MHSRRTCLTLLPATMAMMVASQAIAQSAVAVPRSMIRLLAKKQAPHPCQLADLRWLEGHWIGQMPFGPVESVNLPAAAGHIPGFVRALDGDVVVFYEITVFAQDGDTIAQRVKHFSASLEGWEAREAYLDRKLVARDGDAFYFDGLTLARTGQDSYVIYYLYRDGDKELDTIVVPFKRII